MVFFSIKVFLLGPNLNLNVSFLPPFHSSLSSPPSWTSGAPRSGWLGSCPLWGPCNFLMGPEGKKLIKLFFILTPKGPCRPSGDFYHHSLVLIIHRICFDLHPIKNLSPLLDLLPCRALWQQKDDVLAKRVVQQPIGWWGRQGGRVY